MPLVLLKLKMKKSSVTCAAFVCWAHDLMHNTKSERLVPWQATNTNKSSKHCSPSGAQALLRLNCPPPMTHFSIAKSSNLSWHTNSNIALLISLLQHVTVGLILLLHECFPDQHETDSERRGTVTAAVSCSVLLLRQEEETKCCCYGIRWQLTLGRCWSEFWHTRMVRTSTCDFAEGIQLQANKVNTAVIICLKSSFLPCKRGFSWQRFNQDQ